MRLKLAIPIALLLAASCTAPKNQAELSGQFFNLKAPFAMIENLGINDTLFVDSIGHFSTKVNISEPTYFTLIAGNSYNTIILSPGDKLTVSIDINNPAEGVVFGGKAARKNEVILSVDSIFGGVMEDHVAFFSLNGDALLLKLDTLRSNALEVLSGGAVANDAFNKLEEARIHYRILELRHQYVSYHPRVMGLAPSPSRDGYKFMDEVDFNNEGHLAIPNYRTLVGMDIEHRLWGEILKLGEIEDWRKESKRLYNILIDSLVPNTSIAEYLRFDNTSMGMIFSSLEVAQELAQDFTARSSNPKYQKEVAAILARRMLLAPGKPAPNFSLTAIDGSTYTLADFKGKLVYIDFWSTWCGPCRMEIPHLKKVKEAYEGKPIAFVAISLDTDKAAWEEFVAKEGLTGYQFNDDAGWWSSAAQSYQVRGVPTFVLIDAEGNIIQYNAPRASDPKLAELLDEHLARML